MCLRSCAPSHSSPSEREGAPGRRWSSVLCSPHHKRPVASPRPTLWGSRPALSYWEHLGATYCLWHQDGLSSEGLTETQPGSVSAHCAFWCCGLGGGEMEELYSHPVLFLPWCHLIILTPFCTQCYAVEHENKNSLPQADQESRHELVRASPQNLGSLLCPHRFRWLVLIAVSLLVHLSPEGENKCTAFVFKANCLFMTSETAEHFQIDVHFLAYSGAFIRVSQFLSEDWV